MKKKFLLGIILLISSITHQAYTQDQTKTDAATTLPTTPVVIPKPEATSLPISAKVDTKVEPKKTVEIPADKPVSKVSEKPKEKLPELVTPGKTTIDTKKEDISLKTSAQKTVELPKPTSAKGNMAPLLNKFEKVQTELIGLIPEAKKYATANPTEKEAVLEQFGMIFGIVIGALEEVSGEKLFDVEAMEAAAAAEAGKTTKQTQRKSVQKQQGLPQMIKPEPKKVNSRGNGNGAKKLSEPTKTVLPKEVSEQSIVGAGR